MRTQLVQFALRCYIFILLQQSSPTCIRKRRVTTQQQISQEKRAIIQFIWVIFYFKVSVLEDDEDNSNCLHVSFWSLYFFILCQDRTRSFFSFPLVFIFAKKGYRMSYNIEYSMRQRRKNCTNFEVNGCDDKLIMAIVVTVVKKNCYRQVCLYEMVNFIIFLLRVQRVSIQFMGDFSKISQQNSLELIYLHRRMAVFFLCTQLNDGINKQYWTSNKKKSPDNLNCDC